MTGTVGVFEEKLKLSRDRVAALAERAGRLREKLEAETALLQSMERLAAEARNAIPPPRVHGKDREDDGTYLASDGWEIALISEEGK